jgi:hypothetical protein
MTMRVPPALLQAIADQCDRPIGAAGGRTRHPDRSQLSPWGRPMTVLVYMLDGGVAGSFFGLPDGWDGVLDSAGMDELAGGAAAGGSTWRCRRGPRAGAAVFVADMLERCAWANCCSSSASRAGAQRRAWCRTKRHRRQAYAGLVELVRRRNKRTADCGQPQLPQGREVDEGRVQG